MRLLAHTHSHAFGERVSYAMTNEGPQSQPQPQTNLNQPKGPIVAQPAEYSRSLIRVPAEHQDLAESLTNYTLHEVT